MTLWECLGCGCRYAAGAPRCPECPETAHREVEVPNITSAGVFYEPGKEPPGWAPEPDPEPEADPEAPAEPEPPADPVISPPRRVPPPAAR
jgi:hypothetical protein